MRAALRAAPAVPPNHPCRSASRSHVGLVRKINEDRVLDDPAAGLWAVVDGMGGHSGGDLAAQAVVDALRRSVPPLTGVSVCDALQAANATIDARNRRLRLDAGATAVTALLTADGLAIAWAGDSRAYRLHDGRAEQLTHDHSVVQELVDAGLITPAQAETHPHANMVTRAVGVRSAVLLDRRVVPAQGRFLLCSDGLSRSLRDGDVNTELPLDRLADALVANALARDGSDNLSLVLIDIG